MPGELALSRVLWPALLLVVLAFVVVDFVRHPYLGQESEAAVASEPHLTLWLAQTESSGQAGAVAHETAGSLLLYGRPATVGLLAGGASQAVTGFLSHRHPADQLLAVGSETLADLAQERTSALPGEDPLRAALAQRLLARAVPIAVLGGEALMIAVPRSSPIRDVGGLLAQVRRSPQALVFAITDDNWATDNLAALVQDAGVDGVVPYRVFPSEQDASLALAAGSAEVVLATRGALLSDVRARRLRTLAWPTAAGSSPRAWVELLAAPGSPTASVADLRRQLRALAGNAVWRKRLREDGRAAGLGGRDSIRLSGASLRGFLAGQIAQTTRLEQLALRVERR